MTHSDIKTKFLIEYDKMTTTSSYPSLTDYEIATVLDKAYHAVIANKLTGNNARRVQFESDNKAIEDIRPLVTTADIAPCTDDVIVPDNCKVYKITSDLNWMYYLHSRVETIKVNTIAEDSSYLTVSLVSHMDAQRFMQTNTNLPWIPQPVLYIEGDYLHLLYDPYRYSKETIGDLFCTYIQKPALFVLPNDQVDFGTTEFELNDNVAEEVINTAILMSAEIVESTRLTTKAQISSIES